MAATTTESTAAEMEETVARISSHKGVEGVIIMDRRGTYGIDRYTVCFVIYTYLLIPNTSSYIANIMYFKFQTYINRI